MDEVSHEKIFLTVAALDGTSIADWAPHGAAYAHLTRVRHAIQPYLEHTPFTDVIFHQGERDNLLGTTSDAYTADLRALITEINGFAKSIPIYVCQASWRSGVVSRQITDAQLNECSRHGNVRMGPNTDALGMQYRYDGTHFNDKGLLAFAEMLVHFVEKQRRL